MTPQKRITNPDKIKDIKYFYTAKLSVWIDKNDDYKHYIYRDKLDAEWKKKDPETAVKSYQGSSTKGKNIPKENLLKAMSETSKDILYEILETSGENGTALTDGITGFHESRCIVEHLLDGFDIFNESFSGTGAKTRKLLVSDIKNERLLKKHEKFSALLQQEVETGKIDFKLLETDVIIEFPAEEDLKGWKLTFKKKDRIEYLIENKKCIQSRNEKEGNPESIAGFIEQMILYPHGVWDGKLSCYMPEEESGDDEEIGNGNQSGRAVISPRVLLEGLWSIDMPFKDHDGIIQTDKEHNGNVWNPRETNVSWAFNDADFERDINNTIKDYGLVDKEGNVDTNHPKIQKAIKELNVTRRVYEPLLRSVLKIFKENYEKEQKRIENSYNYTPAGTKCEKGYINNNVNMLDIVKRCMIKEWEKESGHKFVDGVNFTVLSAGSFFVEGGVSTGVNIFRQTSLYRDKYQKFPEAYGFLIYFKLNKDIETYNECDRLHKGIEENLHEGIEGKTSQMSNILEMGKAFGTDLFIEVAPMTDETIEALPYYDEVVQEIKDELQQKNETIYAELVSLYNTLDEKNRKRQLPILQHLAIEHNIQTSEIGLTLDC